MHLKTAHSDKISTVRCQGISQVRSTELGRDLAAVSVHSKEAVLATVLVPKKWWVGKSAQMKAWMWAVELGRGRERARSLCKEMAKTSTTLPHSTRRGSRQCKERTLTQRSDPQDPSQSIRNSLEIPFQRRMHPRDKDCTNQGCCSTCTCRPQQRGHCCSQTCNQRD